MKKTSKLLIGIITVFFIVTAINYDMYASVIQMETFLNAAQEVPPNDGPGNGSGNISYDTDANLLSWNIQFADLSGSPVGAHFHGPAGVGANAGIKVDIGGISGLISPMVGNTNINEEDEPDLLNNLWYVNIHTPNFPGGEIRGQVNALEDQNVIPEPATLQLIGSGLLILTGLRRKFKFV